MADKAPSSPPSNASAFCFEPDPLIHGRIRLGIVSALAAGDRLTFGDLKRLLATTDGNLSTHARKLETAGYIECDKTFAGRKPRTRYRLSPKGRAALITYLDQMERMLALARKVN